MKDPKHRWYVALKELSGAFKLSFPAQVRDDSGNFLGHIFHGTLYEIAEASANLCLAMHADHPVRDERTFLARLYDDYGKELVIGTILALIAAIIGAFFG